MNTDSFLNSSKFIVLVVLLAALSRLLPHPYNFTPIAAMALFGGTYLNNRSSALLLTITGMLLSDLLLQGAYWLGWRDYPGFHALMPVIYLSLALVTTIGSRLSGRVFYSEQFWRVLLRKSPYHNRIGAHLCGRNTLFWQHISRRFAIQHPIVWLIRMG